ncbi:hypothetical protein ILUMI_08668 [Ignelater luminosus]|uniref:Uncharacterized protein n=1 Tax=Ignelater luminosus TaxID=2038154 RepID=A0A8K0D5Q6_IGNLU|nr:hypothetical protein ILUMI_08668 [Ignelater luminosus]
MKLINRGLPPKKTYNVLPQFRNTVSEEEKEAYGSMFPSTVKDLTEPRRYIPEIQNHYIKVLEGNTPNHRQATRLIVVTTYKALELPKNLTPENIYLASILGWCVDLNGRPRFDSFTVERYKMISRYKEAYPAAVLPVVSAMYLAKLNDINLYKQIKSILSEIRNYFVVKNDILDCYGDPLITGKIGSDIRDGKCTWLITKALEKATHNQKEVLKYYYGRPDLQSELEIKMLYEDLDVLKDFLEYEEESYNLIRERIRQKPEDFPQHFF